MINFRQLAYCTLFAIGLSSTPLYAQDADSLRANAEQVLDAFNVPGLAVVAVKDGEVILAEGFGVRDIETQAPVTAETLFGIASNTKAFTSAAMATLVEQGKLDWDDRVIAHLPEFRLADAELTANLTIRDLLSHRSGLGLGAGDLMIWPSTAKSTEQLIAGLANVPIATDRRQRFAYNNLMFVTAGEIIARVSGMPYADYITETFLAPLKMTQTRVGYSNIPASNTNRAVGTIEMNGELHRFPLNYLEDFSSAGAMAANVEELGNWLITQLQQGVSPSGEQLFSADSQRQMWQLTTPLPVSSQTENNGTNFRGVGLGWFVKDYHGVKHVSHSGGILGMLSLTTLIPEHNFGMVVLSNQQAFGALTVVTEEALEDLLELPDRDWLAAEQQSYQEFMAQKAAFELSPPAVVREALPLASYAGRYNDAWYGDILLQQQQGQLHINFTHTDLLKGKLEHYNGDTFIVRWQEPLLEADAFIHFAVNEENQVQSASMEAIAPFTDFSFDFHNLKLIKSD